MPKDIWKNSSIQFPRLLAEIMAVGLTEAQWDGLLESMDLESDRLSELFERAQKLFEVQKAAILGDSTVPISCPYCKEGIMHFDEHPLDNGGFPKEDEVWNFVCTECEREWSIDLNGEWVV
jgi:hypothetical protein